MTVGIGLSKTIEKRTRKFPTIKLSSGTLAFIQKEFEPIVLSEKS
jgi:hypothetical protein